MFNIKRQQQSEIHFANNPQQSIYAFPTAAHTEITAAATTTVFNSVSSSKNTLLPSSSLSSSSSSVLSTTLSPLSSAYKTSFSSISSSSPSNAPSAQSTTKTIGKSSHKLSTGAIAGIIVACSCVLIGILLIAFLLLVRRRNAKKNRLTFDNEKMMQKAVDEKQAYPNHRPTHSETSSPTPLVNQQPHFINPDHINQEEEEDEEIFWNAPPIGTFRVISTYTQTLDDELFIQPGDKVQIYMEYDDGWCLGINLTRGGSRGVFPQHCINMERPL